MCKQGHPNTSPVSWVYGPWDNPPHPTHPWSFWQYTSSGRLNSFNHGNSNLDLNVAQGGEEFLKDRLVPAIWTTPGDGEWTTLTNWNSGQGADRAGPRPWPSAACRRAHLACRAIANRETIRSFSIGLTPTSPSRLLRGLTKSGSSSCEKRWRSPAAR